MRKSAHMLKAGMTVVIDGQERQVTAVKRDEETQRVVITCGEIEYRRTFGAKIDVTSRHS